MSKVFYFELDSLLMDSR